MKVSERNKRFPVRFPEAHETVHEPVERQEFDSLLAHQKFGHSIERHAGTHPKRFTGTRGSRWAKS